MVNAIKQTKPVKKKLLPKKGVLLKKQLADITKDIDWLGAPKNKFTRNRLEKMLTEHFSEHTKLRLDGNHLRLLWARLGIFAQNETTAIVPDVASEHWTRNPLRLRALRIELARTLMPLILKLAGSDPDSEEE